MSWPLALATCLAGVLLGDFVVYVLGYFYGEKVLSLPLTRRLLTRQREAQIKGYFHRHGFKILVSGRFVPGFRTAAYLTAGILKLPPLKLLVTDLVAVFLSTTTMFGLGLLFAHQIQKGIREVQQWITVIVAVGVGGWLLYRYYRARPRRAADRPARPGGRRGPPASDGEPHPVAARAGRARRVSFRARRGRAGCADVRGRSDADAGGGLGCPPPSNAQPEPRTAASEGGDPGHVGGRVRRPERSGLDRCRVVPIPTVGRVSFAIGPRIGGGRVSRAGGFSNRVLESFSVQIVLTPRGVPDRSRTPWRLQRWVQGEALKMSPDPSRR